MTLLSEPDILDACEMESEFDDSEDEVDTLEELEEVLECFEFLLVYVFELFLNLFDYGKIWEKNRKY